MQTIVDDAVAAYGRALFWETFDAGYAALADDSDRWAEVQAERAGEEPTLRDGSR